LALFPPITHAFSLDFFPKQEHNRVCKYIFTDIITKDKQAMTTDITTVSPDEINAFSFPLTDIAGQLSPSSRRIYAIDTKHFATWMHHQGISPQTMTDSDLTAYRVHLNEEYQPLKKGQTEKKLYSRSAKQRMFSVASRLMRKQCIRQGREDITKEIKGFKTQGETTHTAMSKEQAGDMLRGIDQSTKKGKRDYALVLLLAKTGIRRAELVALNMEDIQMKDGHHVAIIQHGKGDKLRIVKLRVDVHRVLAAYSKELGIKKGPLFVGFDKGDKPTRARLNEKTVERIVKKYAPDGVEHLTPHGMRATFITLAIEGGATLQKVQYAAGHKRPETTERYHTRKLNLDNNAVDVLDF
jgi:integrase